MIAANYFVYLPGLDTRGFQARLDRTLWIAIITFEASEPLFLSRRDDKAVRDQGRRAVMIERRNTENVQSSPYSRVENNGCMPPNVAVRPARPARPVIRTGWTKEVKLEMAQLFDLIAFGLLAGIILAFFVLALNSRGPGNPTGSGA